MCISMMVYKCLDASNIVKKMVLHAKVVQLFNKTRTYFLTTFHNNASETLSLLVNPADLGLL